MFFLIFLKKIMIHLLRSMFRDLYTREIESCSTFTSILFYKDVCTGRLRDCGLLHYTKHKAQLAIKQINKLLCRYHV